MWAKITDPSNGKISSLNSKRGYQLLKHYVQSYIKGGGDVECIGIANFEKYDVNKSGTEKVLLPMKCDHPKNKRYCQMKKHGILLYHSTAKPNMDEVSIQQQIPFTPDLKGPFKCDHHSQSRDYLVTELLDKDLFTFISDNDQYDFPVFIQSCINIFKSTAALHKKNYGHFDIKPENIVVKLDPTTKKMVGMLLIDFGTAELFKKTGYRTDGRLSTVGYMDPFVKRGEKLNGKTDIWSLGIVLLVFFIRTMDVVYEPGRKNKHDFHKFIHRQIEKSKKIPDVLRPLLRKMLEKDSIKRIKCEDAIKELKGILKKTQSPKATKKTKKAKATKKAKKTKEAKETKTKAPISFKECAQHNPVMESLPEQCYDKNSDRWFVNGQKGYRTHDKRFCCDKKTKKSKTKRSKTKRSKTKRSQTKPSITKFKKAKIKLSKRKIKKIKKSITI